MYSNETNRCACEPAVVEDNSKQKAQQAYSTYERPARGTVTSIDVTPNLIREFITADVIIGNLENVDPRVKDFFEHFNEVLSRI